MRNRHRCVFLLRGHFFSRWLHVQVYVGEDYSFIKWHDDFQRVDLEIFLGVYKLQVTFSIDMTLNLEYVFGRLGYTRLVDFFHERHVLYIAFV